MPQDLRAEVRRAMRQTGLTPARLAETSGVPLNTLTNWLRGDNQTINSHALEKIFSALNLHLTSK